MIIQPDVRIGEPEKHDASKEEVPIGASVGSVAARRSSISPRADCGKG
jgi:hypothetical protein